MKTIKTLIGVAALMLATVSMRAADFTNSFTVKMLDTATNIAVIPFAKYDLQSHQFGFGIAGLYKVSDNFWTGLRIDRINGAQTSAGVQAQLQQTFQMGPVTVTPFIEASVGIGSTSLYGSAGPGGFIHLYSHDFARGGSPPIHLSIGAVGDFEHVVFNTKRSNQVNGGPLLNISF